MDYISIDRYIDIQSLGTIFSTKLRYEHTHTQNTQNTGEKKEKNFDCDYDGL